MEKKLEKMMLNCLAILSYILRLWENMRRLILPLLTFSSLFNRSVAFVYEWFRDFLRCRTRRRRTNGAYTVRVRTYRLFVISRSACQNVMCEGMENIRIGFVIVSVTLYSLHISNDNIICISNTIQYFAVLTCVCVNGTFISFELVSIFRAFWVKCRMETIRRVSFVWWIADAERMNVLV